MSALRVSVPGVEVRFVDLGPDNGLSAKTAIGGGVIVRPGPTISYRDKERRDEYRKRTHERELELQRIRRAKGKR